MWRQANLHLEWVAEYPVQDVLAQSYSILFSPEGFLSMQVFLPRFSWINLEYVLPDFLHTSPCSFLSNFCAGFALSIEFLVLS